MSPHVQCQDCDKTFRAEPVEDPLHLGETYECPGCGETTYRCPECGEGFAIYELLRDHYSGGTCDAPSDSGPDDAPDGAVDRGEGENSEIEGVGGAVLVTIIGIVLITIGDGLDSAIARIVLIGVGTLVIPVGVVLGTYDLGKLVLGAASNGTAGDSESTDSAGGLRTTAERALAGLGQSLSFIALCFLLASATSGAVSLGFFGWGMVGMFAVIHWLTETPYRIASAWFWSRVDLTLPRFARRAGQKYAEIKADSNSGRSRAPATDPGSDVSSTATDTTQSRTSGPPATGGGEAEPGNEPTETDPNGSPDPEPVPGADAGGDPGGPETVTEGDAVRVGYTARTADSGDVVDTTDSDLAVEAGLPGADHVDGPRTIVVGRGLVFGPVDRDMDGSAVGDTNTVRVPAAAAFGPTPVDPDLRTSAVADLPEGFRFEGAHVRLDGDYRYVTTVVGSRAQVNFGHPLAGQNLVVTYRILESVDGERVDPDPGYLVQYREDSVDDTNGGIDWGPRAREMRRDDQ